MISTHPLHRLLVLCSLVFLTLSGRAESFGTFVKELNYQVVAFARDPQRPRIYATTEGNTLIVIDTTTVNVVAEILIGSGPAGLDISPDGTRLYVACSGSTTAGIGIIDLNTLQKLPSLPTPYVPADVAAGLGNRLYITPGYTGSYQDVKQISAIDGSVQATLPGFAYYSSQLLLTPDRQKLFIADMGLSPASLLRFDVSGAMPVFEQEDLHGNLGSNGRAPVMSHGGQFLCYPTGSGQNSYQTALIPVTNVNGQIGLFNVGAYPSNGAFSPDDAHFYAAPQSQHTLRRFSTTTFLQTGQAPLPPGEESWTIITDGTGDRIYLAGETKLRVYGLTPFVPLVLTVPGDVTVNRGQPVNATATCNHATATFSATGLPPGVAIDPATGVISGQTTTAGNFQVSVTATSGLQTDTETFNVFVLAPFTVLAMPGGSVSPAYAGTTWQKIGSSYQIVATPDPGFGFLKWTGSGLAPVEQPTLIGVVSADLTFTAHFAQLTDLTVIVNGPGSATLEGVSQQLVGKQITLVAYPDAGARFINWTGPFTNSQPSILVTVTAGMTLTANFELLPTTDFTVTVQGPGTVTPAELVGTSTQAIGATLNLSAIAHVGSRFVGWSGSITSTVQFLSVVVEPDMELVANFESLTPYVGSYRLVTIPGADGIAPGRLDLTLSEGGSFTSKLDYDGTRYSLNSSFTGPRVQVSFPRGGQAPLLLDLELEQIDGVPTLLGAIGDGAKSYPMAGHARVTYSGKNPTTLAGRYTFHLPPPIVPAGAPRFGHGYGSARVTRSGLITLTGVLGDATPFSTGSFLTAGDHAPVQAMLIRAGAVLSGIVDFGDEAESDFQAALGWLRSPQISARRFPAGFNTPVTLLGSRYVPSSGPGIGVLSYRDARVTYSAGNLSADLTSDVRLRADGSFTAQAGDPLRSRARFEPKSGAWSGAFFAPGAKDRTPFSGVIFTKTGHAFGQFRGTTEVGSAVLAERN